MRPHHTRLRSSRRGPGSALAAIVLGAVLLAGCSAPAPDLDREAAAQLQSKVLAVTQAAAANDPAASLTLLDELARELDEAASGGAVSFKRHQSVRSAIDAVRAELASQQAAKAAADQEAAAQAAAKAAADAVAAPPVAAAPAPAPAVIAPAPENPGKGGKGKGKD